MSLYFNYTKVCCSIDIKIKKLLLYNATKIVSYKREKMQLYTLKNVNNYWNTTITFNTETSGVKT